MHIRLAAFVLAIGAMSSGLHAQSFETRARVEPVRATARLATQGIGYSVVYQDPAVPTGPYRVKVVCTVGQISAIAQCPTTSHDAHCPMAQIVCR